METPPIFEGEYMGLNCVIRHGVLELIQAKEPFAPVGVFVMSHNQLLALWNRVAWLDEAKKHEPLALSSLCRQPERTQHIEAFEEAANNAEAWRIWSTES